MDRDPGEIYHELTRGLGKPVYDRVEAPATPEQRAMLERLSGRRVRLTDLAEEKIQTILTHAPGNRASVRDGRHPKDLYESFRGADHLRRILEQEQTIVSAALAPAPQRSGLAGNTNLEGKQ